MNKVFPTLKPTGCTKIKQKGDKNILLQIRSYIKLNRGNKKSRATFHLII